MKKIILVVHITAIFLVKLIAQNNEILIANKGINSKVKTIGIVIENSSSFEIPSSFFIKLYDLNYSKLSTVKSKYKKISTTIETDYLVTITLKSINISPNKQRKKKKIERNVLVNQGCTNRTIPITCTITETLQSKQVLIKGSIVYSDISGKVLMVLPLSCLHKYEYSSFQMEGNKRAVSGRSKSLLKSHPHPKPFPSDKEMLLSSRFNLKKVIAKSLSKNIKSFEKLYK